MDECVLSIFYELLIDPVLITSFITVSFSFFWYLPIVRQGSGRCFLPPRCRHTSLGLCSVFGMLLTHPGKFCLLCSQACLFLVNLDSRDVSLLTGILFLLHQVSGARHRCAVQIQRLIRFQLVNIRHFLLHFQITAFKVSAKKEWDNVKLPHSFRFS